MSDDEAPVRIRGPGAALQQARKTGEKLTEKELKDKATAAARRAHQGGVASNAYAKFDNTLCTDTKRGMADLVRRLRGVQQHGKGHELRDLRDVLWHYRAWAKDLVPSRPFPQFVRELRLVPEGRWHTGYDMTRMHFEAQESGGTPLAGETPPQQQPRGSGGAPEAAPPPTLEEAAPEDANFGKVTLFRPKRKLQQQQGSPKRPRQQPPTPVGSPGRGDGAPAAAPELGSEDWAAAFGEG
eukprot:TRINITY_DN7494_c0_g1_i1.p2 TRINITY_DN7494_c0_g1~~TRINITY_DN7494_c0_g1_i1.p2  ORF type:complete len:240 (+),score=82.74 TRINITY_DN7494_c0_g1_i1:86-805(+)